MKVLAADFMTLEEAKGRKLCRSRRGTNLARATDRRIRTYIFPQEGCDHRINLTLYRIDDIMDGDLDELIDALTVAYKALQANEL